MTHKAINSALAKTLGQLKVAGERARDLGPLIEEEGFIARDRILNGEDPQEVNRDYQANINAARVAWNDRRSTAASLKSADVFFTSVMGDTTKS